MTNREWKKICIKKDEHMNANVHNVFWENLCSSGKLGSQTSQIGRRNVLETGHPGV